MIPQNEAGFLPDHFVTFADPDIKIKNISLSFFGDR